MTLKDVLEVNKSRITVQYKYDDHKKLFTKSDHYERDDFEDDKINPDYLDAQVISLSALQGNIVIGLDYNKTTLYSDIIYRIDYNIQKGLSVEKAIEKVADEYGLSEERIMYFKKRYGILKDNEGC